MAADMVRIVITHGRLYTLYDFITGDVNTDIDKNYVRWRIQGASNEKDI